MARSRLLIPVALFCCFVIWRLTLVSAPPELALSFEEEVMRLHQQAKATHEAMLARQSRTLNAARSEYARRYGIRPPPRFDLWFDYAKSQGSKIIDDYDSIVEDLKPFAGFLEGRGWNEGRCDLYSKPDPDHELVHVCVRGHNIEVSPTLDPELRKRFVEPLQDMIGDFITYLPEVCFQLNTLDESRVAMPYTKDDIKTHAEIINDAVGIDLCKPQEWQELSKQNVWKNVIKACPDGSPARTRYARKQSTSPAKNLIDDWNDATDLCMLSEAPPSGLVQSPAHMLLGERRVPVLSSGKLSSFNDVRYPSLVRWRDTAEITELFDFGVKRHVLGWRGVSSGGWATGDVWQNFQRHRMVSVAQAHAVEEAPAVRRFGEHDLISTTPTLRKRLDIGFTRLESCDPESCDAMRREFRVVDSLQQTQVLANRVVLDMDGDGISARFYQLLASNSAVLKQGLVREWHDSRLTPWLHYIPLSMGMLELPELLAFLFDTDRGRNITETIAMEGKAWAGEALRHSDMRVYMYRLLLEMGRRDFSAL